MPISQERLYRVVRIAKELKETVESLKTGIVELSNSEGSDAERLERIIDYVANRGVLDPESLEVIEHEELHYRFTHKDNARRRRHMQVVRSAIGAVKTVRELKEPLAVRPEDLMAELGLDKLED